MKQTAVSWLVEEFDLTSESPIIKNVVEQAKEMHKQEIIDAFYEGMNCQNFDPNKGRAEIYYNETFKSDQMKTAVEWFANQVLNARKLGFISNEKYNELLEQAKEMEKEQHQETFKQSRLAKVFDKNMPPVWESWEQYYLKETFKNKYGTE